MPNGPFRADYAAIRDVTRQSPNAHAIDVNRNRRQSESMSIIEKIHISSPYQGSNSSSRNTTSVDTHTPDFNSMNLIVIAILRVIAC